MRDEGPTTGFVRRARPLATVALLCACGGPAALRGLPEPLASGSGGAGVEAVAGCEVPTIDLHVVTASRRLPRGLSYELRAPDGARVWACAGDAEGGAAVPVAEGRCARACDWYRGPGRYELRVRHGSGAGEQTSTATAPIEVDARGDAIDVRLRFSEQWPGRRVWLTFLVVRALRSGALDGLELVPEPPSGEPPGTFHPLMLDRVVAFRLVNGSRETVRPEDRRRGFAGRLARRTSRGREPFDVTVWTCGEVEPQADLAPGEAAQSGLGRHIRSLYSTDCCPLPAGRYELVVQATVVRSPGTTVDRPEPARAPEPRLLDVYVVSHDVELTEPAGWCPFHRADDAPPCPGSLPP